RGTRTYHPGDSDVSTGVPRAVRDGAARLSGSERAVTRTECGTGAKGPAAHEAPRHDQYAAEAGNPAAAQIGAHAGEAVTAAEHAAGDRQSHSGRAAATTNCGHGDQAGSPFASLRAYLDCPVRCRAPGIDPAGSL